MKSFLAITLAAALWTSAASSHAQSVITYYPSSVPVTTYYSAAVPVTTYYAPSVPVTAYYPPSVPVTTYYPATTYYVPATTTYYAPAYVVRPKVYVRGQPVRNVLRAITP